MNVLVTGGGGFLGLYIVEQLVDAGETVRVFCRGEYPRLQELNVETVQGDIRDAEAVLRACEGIETVYHTAAVSGIWGAWDYFYSINTQGTLNVLEACQKQGVTRLVYTSSPSVVYDGAAHENATEKLPYSEHYLCHYPHTKMLAEKAVLAANGEQGLATVALRPHLIWGPRDNHLIPRLIQRAKSGRLRQVGDGTNLISMSYVENAAAAHLQAAARLFADSPVGGQAYFINEPEPVLIWEWINQLLSLAGLPPVQKKISVKAAQRIGGVLEFVYRMLHLPGEPPMTRFLASQLSSSHYYDISRARHDFGYQPIVDFEEAMRRMEPELKRLAAQ
ncbi:NAD-dependent epimerase/dehydratase family protein [Gimesia fumaroli]|uniref:3 beta-hydroxysteroid dehydrogenase/Delta 5-->4-isomerase n=1 Tax=Gimesia fumaroli TaxID=2527976 RepID=A0A518IAJ8_9PLAN|nr:NAD-dependent epimerase/dehydratase family protein [Gimesia fumaroli]QDV50127.1 3 beta-hydroxysteroid dehydrogenase/Delta 5-->4-isomerase [Gimesia fumaroli]